MKLELDAEIAGLLADKLPSGHRAVGDLKRGLRYGSTTLSIDFWELDRTDLDQLYDLAKERNDRSVMMQVAGVRNALDNPFKNKISGIRSLIPGLVTFINTDAIDGWLYSVDKRGNPHPWLVTSMSYHEPRDKDDRPSVSVKLVANGHEQSERSLSFLAQDCHNATVPDLLIGVGFQHETPELKTRYLEDLAKFEQIRPTYNMQYWLNRSVTKHESYSYNSSRRGPRESLTMTRSKVINDEATADRKFRTRYARAWWEERGCRNPDLARRLAADEDLFTQMPYHTYIRVFHLDFHDQYWVHVGDLEPYVYDTSLRDKIVLPPLHRDLIEVLTSNLELFKELPSDFIEGKSGGTSILCKGGPGLGKTLTAEVYSEVSQRPLYRVHAGHLGTDADEVEKHLKSILKRAARWGAVLLLDEADVYIRKRGNDLDHNAVVASFLRTLEYFDGLMFMTTNRSDDVDDAILSRCIAVITYEPPSEDELRQLWRILGDTILPSAVKDNLTDELIEDLLVLFQDKKISGRDIKEILKLSARLALPEPNVIRPITKDTIRQCAQFRGI